MIMEMNYCRRCGHELVEKGADFWQCDQSHSTYLNPSPAAGVFIVTDDDEVILAKRGIEPGLGMLDTFGGFVDSGESAEAAIEREILEETGLTRDQYGELRIFCTAPMKYHYENEDRPVLSTFFWTHLLGDAVPQARDDVSDVIIMPLRDFDLNLLHGDDVKAALTKLQEISFTN